MRSVVDVITTRTPEHAIASRRQSIPSALPAPVITAVCLFKWQGHGMPEEASYIGRVSGSLYLLVFQAHRWLDRSFSRATFKSSAKTVRTMFDRGVLVMDFQHHSSWRRVALAVFSAASKPK